MALFSSKDNTLLQRISPGPVDPVNCVTFNPRLTYNLNSTVISIYYFLLNLILITLAVELNSCKVMNWRLDDFKFSFITGQAKIFL